MARQSKKTGFFITITEVTCLSAGGLIFDLLVLYGMATRESGLILSLPPLPGLGFNALTFYLWWMICKAIKLQGILGYLDYSELLALRRSPQKTDIIPADHKEYVKKYLPYCLWITNARTRWGIRFLLIGLIMLVFYGISTLPFSLFMVALGFCCLGILKIAQGIMDVV